LHGKESIDAIKDETLFKAYESIKDENQLKRKAISAFGVGSRALSFSAFGFKLSAKELSEKLEAYDEEKKIEEAESFIENGGVICLDDFERKSKNIDLNDLFGFISQLSLELNCKVIIILNSDVFSGDEAEVFRRVKEKTVNKFFYYEPTIEELFYSIAKNKKYDDLTFHKEDIFNAITETEELNARVYIQVLNNCLEWNKEQNLDENITRTLVLATINFILNHVVFDYTTLVKVVPHDELYELQYSYTKKFPLHIQREIERVDLGKFNPQPLNSRFRNECLKVSTQEKLNRLIDDQVDISDIKIELAALWKYGFSLYYITDVNEKTYNKIAKFIKTGILL